MTILIHDTCFYDLYLFLVLFFGGGSGGKRGVQGALHDYYVGTYWNGLGSLGFPELGVSFLMHVLLVLWEDFLFFFVLVLAFLSSFSLKSPQKIRPAIRIDWGRRFGYWF